MNASYPNRRSKVAAGLGVVGLATSISVATSTAPAVARPAESDRPAVARFAGELSDLQPGAAGPFDDAWARLLKVEHGSASTFVLQVWGVEPSAVHQEFGAHLHTGPCVAGDGAAAGPHYNASAAAGVQPPVVSDRTEVWLDVTIHDDGSATAVTTVPFVVPPGQRSIVFHAMPTDDHGTAGSAGRLPSGELVMRRRRYAAAGFVLGVGWGVLARVWMRLISDVPSFSWAGTLAILGFSGLLGLLLGVVAAARVGGRRPRWRLLLLAGILLFASPGMIFLPAFVVGGWGWRRGQVARTVAALAVLSAPGLLAALSWETVQEYLVPYPDLVYFAVRGGGALVLATLMAWAGSAALRPWRSGPDATIVTSVGRSEPSAVAS